VVCEAPGAGLTSVLHFHEYWIPSWIPLWSASQVEMLSPSPINCPISLYAPLCPQITPCGHVFSFPAIMQVRHPAVGPLGASLGPAWACVRYLFRPG
jgi:hypothetical protein